MSRVAVIGGGAAGMMAALTAAAEGHSVNLYEKNEKLGKKLYITGKGRCNLTNNCEVEALLRAVCVNRKFLYSAFYGFSSQDTIRFFERAGLSVKTERGGRVFPVSDHSSDVIATLARELKKGGVKIHLNEEVKELIVEPECAAAESEVRAVAISVTQNAGEKEGDAAGKDAGVKKKLAMKGHAAGQAAPLSRIRGLRLASGREVAADVAIVATGGLSYPTTGSTGDGYRFARAAGHQVTELSPSLVPIETAENWAQQMQGLSLRNVELSVFDGKKELCREFGEMMFTHFGVTGPLVLTASCQIQKRLREHPLQLFLDLKPALSTEQLDARILREFEAAKNKQFKNVLGTLFPAKMLPVIAARSGIPQERAVHEITREDRRTLIELTKHFPLTLLRLRDYNEAIVTRGGVSVKELHPATMESKKVRGLRFAGEVLDVDAMTGGFNLQIAWSTGRAAGSIGPNA